MPDICHGLAIVHQAKRQILKPPYCWNKNLCNKSFIDKEFNMNAPREANKMVAAQVSTEKLMEDLRVVVVDAEELLKATASQTGELIAAARIKASESLQVAKARLAETQASAVEKVKVAAKTTDNYVRDNPLQSMGIAAVLGLALGVLISRR
jgi:ElaB/YqjD/DUF883 family membrane-anchored ribosome-binding protein